MVVHILKGMLLFVALLVVVPVLFIVLVGLMGPAFAFEISHDSWLAKTNVRWVRALVRRLM